MLMCVWGGGGGGKRERGRRKQFCLCMVRASWVSHSQDSIHITLFPYTAVVYWYSESHVQTGSSARPSKFLN